MRREPSDAERKLWNLLRNRQLDGLKFRRQLPIGPFVVDFACEDCRLVIEVDGKQHDGEDAIRYDTDRTALLKELGWRVIRFYAGEVVRDIKQVLVQIQAAANVSP